MCSSILSSSDSSRKPSLLVSNTRYTSSISSWLMGLTGGQEDGAGAGRGQVNHAVRQGGIAPDHEAAGEQEEGGRGRWVGDGRRRSGLRGKDVGPGTSCIASGGSAPYNRAMCMGPAVTPAPLAPGEGVWQHGHGSPRHSPTLDGLPDHGGELLAGHTTPDLDRVCTQQDHNGCHGGGGCGRPAMQQDGVRWQRQPQARAHTGPTLAG